MIQVQMQRGMKVGAAAYKENNKKRENKRE
jgi:hypothetical protein